MASGGWPGSVRPLEERDRTWVTERTVEWWGAPIVVARGQVHRPAELDGFIAEMDGMPAGLVTLHISGDGCEVVTLNSMEPGSGAGPALLDAAESYARAHGCTRLWLITTNDNTRALRFYQRWGMRIMAVHLAAIEHSRRLKPEIPAIGADGIPIRDEIELAKELRPA
jgi:GNAT superfamily N-acetyltransferase